MYEWLFEDAIKAGVCNDVSYCIAHYQTLISGAFAVFAAIVTAGAVYWSASMPVREQRKIELQRAEKEDRIKAELKKIVQVEIVLELTEFNYQAKNILTNVLSPRQAGIRIAKDIKLRSLLPTSEFSKSRELLLLLSEDTQQKFLHFALDVNLYNQRINNSTIADIDNDRMDLLENISSIVDLGLAVTSSIPKSYN